MVAAQTTQTHPQYKSYDDMSVYDRSQILRTIDTAKQTTNLMHDWDWQGVWRSQITPEFYNQIAADIQTYRDNAKKEKEIKEAEIRKRNNAAWDSANVARRWQIESQPTDYFGKNIGLKAYKWLKNFKATNGNWYAEYQPVRGGENRKFFDLSLEQWDDNAYVAALQCQSCNHSFKGMAPVPGNVCPQCGAQSDRLRYRGRYSS